VKLLIAMAVLLLLGAFAARRTRARSTPRGARDADQQVLDALRSNGADLSKPTETLFYLYLPTEADADIVAAALRNDGFDADVAPPSDGYTMWLCRATTEMVPDLDAIHRLRDRFTALAGAHGGEYDGWEAAVTE
jgi:rhodanese-related sulfurtransferase